ncbi:MAG TPA: hypothetical protein VJ464_03220 [Blastocatellia bacterium]|nr:hypothetical protein [Blastocatellia bacterium]
MKEQKTLRIVVALAEDVKDAKNDLTEVVDELNRVALAENCPVQAEIIAWCCEGSFPGFYCETPYLLIEEIYRCYSPDIIIGVFWKHFGTDVLSSAFDLEQEYGRASKTWRQPDYSRVLLYLCEKTPDLKNDNERIQREYLIHFRGFFSIGEFWWPYKKKSAFRRTPHSQELSKIAYDHLLQIMRNWQAEGALVSIDLNPPPDLNLPEGWEYISRRQLDELRGELADGNRLDKVEVADYFDGEAPTWKVAASDSVPRRQIVKRLRGEIADAAYAGRLRVTLLSGPGGEGKSTILQQLVVDLTCRYARIHIIWHRHWLTPLPSSLVRQLMKEQDHFVIVSDNAETIAKDVYEQVRLIRDEPRCNIQFLLASRGTDWLWANAPDEFEWRRYLGERDFVREMIKLDSLEDAADIVKAWQDAGSLGHLAEVREEDRARHLLELARGERARNPEEGSLLGAMLIARKSRTFSDYISEILKRLDMQQAPGGRTLKDAFAYIVALHADQRPILSRPVLKRVISCSWEDFDDKVITPLADEAVTDSGWYILARHRMIAEVAKRILSDTAPDRFNRFILPDLLRAARMDYLDKQGGQLDDETIKPWNDLPRYYFRRKQVDLAARLAEVLADVESHDPFPVVTLAHIYRDAEQKQKAANTFRQRYSTVQPNKGYFYEWSVSEGQIGNHCYSTWLSGIALSDFVRERRPGDTPAVMVLSGLTSSLGKLFEKTGDPSNIRFYDTSAMVIFIKACAGAAQLGLDGRAHRNLKPMFDLEESKNHLREGRKLGAENGVGALSSIEALQSIREGINLAYVLQTKDEGELPDSLPDPNTLKFQDLENLLGINEKSDARHQDLPKPPKPRTRF